jgi:oxygen-independent coproporphyrinogen III oxidase
MSESGRGGAGHDPPRPAPVDPALLRRYDVAGPRYTSYPTAPQFRACFGAADFAGLLRRGRAGGKPLSLYVHIPFCATRCFFCGCNVTVARSRARGTRYLAALDREMAAGAELAGGGEREVVQVHWGGGTPTFLPAEDLAALAGIARRRFRWAADCEFGVEIDPRACSPEQLDALAAAGVNRISVGVQDLDPAVQAAVNRFQGAEQTWEVIEGARRRGVSSVNVDLIYGLPRQTRGGLAATLREVVRMAPDRVAVFNFGYLPERFRHQSAIDPAALPDAEEKLRLLQDTSATLAAAGYVFIGMDHFARPEDPLSRALRDGTLTRNFQGYSTCGDTDLLAFGASSISGVEGGYAQNAHGVGEYSARVARARFATCRGLLLTAEDRLRRDIIVRLMCHSLLPKPEIEAAHGIDFDAHFAAELAALRPLAADGLVELRPEALAVTAEGRLLVRNLAMVFDAYLAAPSSARYSRTV